MYLPAASRGVSLGKLVPLDFAVLVYETSKVSFLIRLEARGQRWCSSGNYSNPCNLSNLRIKINLATR